MTVTEIETIQLDADCAARLQSSLQPLADELSLEASLTGNIFDIREPESAHHTVDLSPFNALASRSGEVTRPLLPPNVNDSLDQFLFPDRQHSIVAIKGCPLGNISATPEQYNSQSDAGIGGHLIAAICGMLNGQIVTLLNAISHNVDANGLSAPLGLHIDGHFAGKPNVAVLLCLRGFPGARTVFTTMDEVTEHLSDEHLQILQQPILRSHSGSHAVLRQAHGRWHFDDQQEENQFYFSPDDVLDPSAIEALTSFQRLGTDLLETATGVEMETGDIVVFDNQIKRAGPFPGLLHGRSAFVDDLVPSRRRWVKALVFEV